jgi:hypothetical protein
LRRLRDRRRGSGGKACRGCCGNACEKLTALDLLGHGCLRLDSCLAMLGRNLPPALTKSKAVGVRIVRLD